MNKGDLEKIIAIAEEGSMARAAQKLYITQPALSKSLSKVEAELGEVLFIRRPNGLALTYAGECFVQKAYQIMRLYGEMEIEFCELNQMRRGVLKLGTAERLGALVLPGLLTRFKEKYPNIQIDIVEANSFSLEEKLMMGVLDIAIVCLPLKNENVKYKVFYKDPFYIALPRQHPLNALAYTKPGEDMPYLPLEAIVSEPLVMTSRNKKTRIGAERILSRLETGYQIALELHNIETVIRLVASGTGISLVPGIFSKVYHVGDKVNYYQIEPQYKPYWEWAVIYNESIESLTRPSRELYRILCEEGCAFPNYIE